MRFSALMNHFGHSFAQQKNTLFFQPNYYITKNAKKKNCQKHNNTKLFIFTCKAGGGDNIPPLACSVAGDFYSFDLASRGTALTLRLRDSFQPLTYGLSRKSQRLLHNARIGTSVPLTGIAATVCFCLPAGVSHPALVPADF